MKDEFQFKEMDIKELNLPDTVFIRDIESRVFQAITVKCLSNIESVALIEGNLFDSLLGRDGHEKVKGIYVDQDQKNHSVKIKIELNIAYGISIPDKAEEIQMKIADEVCRLTGLHVSCVHIVFKNLISESVLGKFAQEENLPDEEIESKEKPETSQFEFAEKK